MGQAVPDAEQLLELVGNIYESALDARAMTRVLDGLNRAMGGSVSHIFTWHRPSGRVVDSHMSDVIAPKHNDAYMRYYAGIDPRRAALLALPSGGVLRCHKHFDERFVSRSEFYQDFLFPSDHRWVIGAQFDSVDGTATVVANLRAIGTPAYDDEAELTLRRLMPHLRRAAFLRSQLISRAAQSLDADGLLNALPVGCVLLGGHGRILAKNDAARDALEDLRMSLSERHLLLRQPEDQAALNRCIDRVLVSRLPHTLKLAGTAGSRWAVHVLPCSAIVHAADAVESALLVAVFELLSAAPAVRVSNLRRRFGLTAAEAEVLALLLQGKPVKRIASLRGAQVSTVRSQVSSLFDKTGYRSQRELIAALGGS